MTALPWGGARQHHTQGRPEPRSREVPGQPQVQQTGHTGPSRTCQSQYQEDLVALPNKGVYAQGDWAPQSLHSQPLHGESGLAWADSGSQLSTT